MILISSMVNLSVASIVTGFTKFLLIIVVIIVLGVVALVLWKMISPLVREVLQILKKNETKQEPMEVKFKLETKQSSKKYIINYLKKVTDIKDYRPNALEKACYEYFKKEVEK